MVIIIPKINIDFYGPLEVVLDIRVILDISIKYNIIPLKIIASLGIRL